tara:strand:- start:11211 stop:11753 length:543 start_codon:yes stop_codon:yes gene_type:complete
LTIVPSNYSYTWPEILTLFFPNQKCEKALADKDKAKASVKMLKKKWVSYLAKLVTLTRSKLDKVNRKKVVALITIEVHARDSIEKLLRSGCDAITDFEWVSQLRFYWDAEKDECVVKQVLSVFEYGYEYQGNNGRLVVTPLTDRCYMTLGAAMFTRRGGNPLGPGTCFISQIPTLFTGPL